MSLATLRTHGRVGVITLDNPPVNALSLAHRTSIVAALRAAEADPGIDSVVLIGAGEAFCGGAEIREFNKPESVTAPITRQVAETAESLRKPVTAAIHKIAMGGGLEIALGCHYRVALRGALIALPEVKLGIVPGAGGTQRLPRAIGAQAALDMIVSGEPMRSEVIAKLGLFDAIIDSERYEDLLPAALEFAQRLVVGAKPLRRLRDEPVRVEQPEHLFSAARERIARDLRGFPAPLRCVDAVEAAVTRPFDEGIRFERQCFLELVETTASKSMRHGFFAERAASKVLDLPAGTPVRSLKRVAVIGAGTMGAGIATVFANAGLAVVLIDTGQSVLDRALASIRSQYDAALARGRLNAETMAKRLSLIQTGLSVSEAAGADLVIEAVYEDMELKRQIFAQIEAAVPADTLIATNTSTLDVNQLSASLRHPERSLGLHFFSPAPVMRLLEIVRGTHTGPGALASALAMAKRIRKVAVVSGVCDGFIGNRMLEEYLRQAYFLVDEGASPQAVDQALEAFGMAMGPLRTMDMAGQDIGWAIRKRLARERPEKVYSRWPDLLCERGRFGQKTGRGVYRYEPGSRTALADPEVEDLISQYRREQGIAQRAIAAEEIVERCIFALVNEGARILEEGIAARASDIDVVYLAGYGFPAYRGGPMFYADTIGLDKVCAALEKYRGGRLGACLAPAPMLQRLAGEGKRFNAA
jgi:3-hydroxyacyl-CoA dehydrogenase